MRTPVAPLAALAALVLVNALPLAATAQGYPVIADPMAPAVPPTGLIGTPAIGAPALGVLPGGAPLLGAPVGGAPGTGGAVIVSPGQQLPGYVITPQNSWGTGVITPGNPPTYIVPNNAGGTAIVTPGYGPTLIRPNPAGGTTIIGPDQGTTVIAPTRRGGGGSVIVGPGGTGYLVPTPQGTYIQPPGSVPPAVIYRP
jgi:hypothetical protein